MRVLGPDHQLEDAKDYPKMADQASDDQGMVMITVVGFLLGFTTIFMALRFYTRVVLTDSLWW